MAQDARPVTRNGLAVSGVSLLYGEKPLRRVHVPLSVGLTVMYGLNGAGKTQTLGLLEHAFGGRRTRYRPAVHGELGGVVPTEPSAAVTSFFSAAHQVQQDLAGSEGYLQEEAAGIGRAGYDRSLYAVLRHAEVPADIAAEIAGQRAVTIMNVGGRPLAFAAVRFDGTAPRLEAELGRYPAPWCWQGKDLYRALPGPDPTTPVLDALSGGLQSRYPTLAPTVGDAFLDLDDDLEVLVSTLCGEERYAELVDLLVPEALIDLVRQLLADGIEVSDIAQNLLQQDPSPLPAELTHEAYNTPFDPWLGLRLRVAWDTAHRDPLAPAWVTWPVLQLGFLDEHGWSFDQLGVVHEGLDLKRMFHRALGPVQASGLLATAGDRVVPSAALQDFLDRIGSRATEVIARCVPEAPAVYCTAHVPVEAFEWDLVRFGAQVSPASDVIPLAQLSASQQRWCEVGLRCALVEHLSTQERAPTRFLQDLRGPSSEGVGFVLLDEPDAALHPSARDFLPGGLREMAELSDAAVIVASHATEFHRGGADDHYLHVVRGSELDDSADVVPVTPGEVLQRSGLAALGWTTAELAQLARAFLVVEGPHDEAILSAWLAPTLTRLHARILHMSGDHHLLSILESSVVFDLTEASVLLVLDASSGLRALAKTWSEVRALVTDRDAVAAAARLRAHQRLLPTAQRGQPAKQSTAKALYELMDQALKRGLSDRIDTIIISEHDVLHLLPIAAFPGAGPDWVSFHKKQRTSGKDCKKFLAEVTGRFPTLDVILAVLEQYPLPHPDVTAIDNRLRELCRRPRTTD